MTSLMNTTTVTNLMNTTNTLVITSHNRRQSNSLLMRPPLWPRLSCTHAGHGAPEAKAELELREMQALKEGLCIQQSSFRRSFFFFFIKTEGSYTIMLPQTHVQVIYTPSAANLASWPSSLTRSMLLLSTWLEVDLLQRSFHHLLNSQFESYYILKKFMPAFINSCHK